MNTAVSTILFSLSALFILAFVVLGLRLILKEDKDSTVSYIVAGVIVIIYGITTKGILSIIEIPSYFVGSYFLGTAIWGIVSLIRKITKIVYPDMPGTDK